MSVHDANYKKIKKELGIPEDEPIFVLRAQDILAPPTIQRYLNLARGLANPPSDEWIDAVQECANEMAQWQNDNDAKTKIPD